MLRIQKKFDWCIWIIIATPVLIILLNLYKVIPLFQLTFQGRFESGATSIPIWLLILILLNVLSYFFLLSIGKFKFVRGIKLNMYFRVRFLFHFFISLVFTGLFLKVIQLHVTDMFFIRYFQIMFVCMVGWFIRYVKPNQDIGIRLSWTLSNEAVWEKTHLFTSNYWTSFAMAALLIFPTIDPNYSNLFLIAFFISLFIPPLLYSYNISRKINKRTENT